MPMGLALAHSYSSDNGSTLEEQSDTLTLGFLPPSPPNGINQQANAAAEGNMGGSGSGSNEAATPTKARPRFLGLFRRGGSASAAAAPTAGNANGHTHRSSSLHLPHPHLPRSAKKKNRSSSKPPAKSVDARPTALDRRGPKPRQLLRGCATAVEHYDHIDAILEKTRELRGRRGLEAAGFRYQFVRCPQHATGNDDQHDDTGGSGEEASCPACVTRLHCRYGRQGRSIAINPTNRSRYIADGIMYEEVARLCQEYAQDRMAQEGDLVWVTVCDDEGLGETIRCLVPRGHRLHDDNEGGCCAEEEEKDRPPPQAVDDHSDYPPLMASSPILLITTGKGKVRAGIFSRQHLMTTALEPATALPVVREARKRGIRCVIPDPNCRGDRHGMETYRRSMSRVFEQVDAFDDENDGSGDISQMGANEGVTDSQRSGVSASSIESCSCQGVPIYVLAHSASGAQFVRYLRDHSPSRHQVQQLQPGEGNDAEDLDITPALISRIRAVAFTDSTHNIQWTRKDSSHKHLENMLEGDASLYVRVEPEGSGGLGVVPSPIRKTSNGRTSTKKSKSAHGEESEDDEDDPASIHQAVVPRATAGQDADTDQYWNHRFGSVRTVWAGTADHSLTNWAAHDSIWEHFDRHIGKDEEAS
jgi:hypothetical protein